MRAFFDSDHSVEYYKHVRTGTRIMGGLIVLVIVLLVAKPFSPGPGLAIDKYYFSGNTSDNKGGYIAMVNRLLGRYTNDPAGRIRIAGHIPGLGPNMVISEDSSLTFYFPPDRDLNKLRLTGINKFKSDSDRMFYANSLLPEHLKLQAAYPDRMIFTINMGVDKDGREYVEDISIDKNILSVSLISNNTFWQSGVRASLDSMFAGDLFIKLGYIWVPLQSADLPVKVDHFNPYGLPADDTLNYLSSKDQSGLARDVLLHNKRIFRLNIGDSLSLQLLRIKDTLYLYSRDIPKMEIVNAGSAKVLDIANDQKFALPLNGQPFEIRFPENLRNFTGTLYCTRDNPFNKLSYLLDHNRKGFRYAVSPPVVDVFTATMAREIPELENTYWPLRKKQDAGDFQVAYNPILAKYLEDEIVAYIDGSDSLRPFKRNDSIQLHHGRKTVKTIRMGIVLMDTRNARVLAAPWYSRDMAQTKEYKYLVNYNFINHPIGSCFKPLLYFASFRRFPTLSELVLTPDMVSSFDDFKKDPALKNKDVAILGYPTKHFVGDSRGDGETLEAALAHSSNLYPALTFLYSLTENNSVYYNGLTRPGPFPRRLYTGPSTEHVTACKVLGMQLYINALEGNAISDLYKKLYDVEKIDLTLGRVERHEYSYWRRAQFHDTVGTTDEKLKSYGNLSPDKVTLRFDLFNATNSNQRHGHFRYEIVPWILGSQNNRWNNVKLSEAFTRVVTGIRNEGTFNLDTVTANGDVLYQYSQSTTTLKVYPKINEFAAAHLNLLHALDHRSHLSGSTWMDVGEVVKKMSIKDMDSLVILAKTGTADDDSLRDGRVLHRGEFMFTILTTTQYRELRRFIESNYNPDLLPAHMGITGIISLELTDNAENEKMIYSRFAKGFLADTARLSDIIRLNRSLFR